MKQIAVFLLLMFVILAAWSLGSRLSADALAMAIGMVFGVLAVVPGLVIRQLAAQRGDLHGCRHERYIDAAGDYRDSRQPAQLLAERTTVTVTITERVYADVQLQLERRGQS